MEKHIGALVPQAELRDQILPELAARAHLFASTSVFLSSIDVQAMRSLVEAIEHTVRLDGYREAVALRSQDAYAEHPTPAPGLILGYDFHLAADGPKLIEINTNAGGAFLAAALAAAAGPTPCGDVYCNFHYSASSAKRLVDIFAHEWRRAGRAGHPRRIAIVDDAPREQYLYPDMLLARAWLDNAGYAVEITDASELTIHRQKLIGSGPPIDFVYNRTTDFALMSSQHAVLKQAWLENLALISPAPEHHRRYADKRNLVLLSSPRQLAHWGLAERYVRALSAVPTTYDMSPELSEALWQRRKDLYFKPVDGFGGKAVYRGEKLTQRKWAAILDGNYVAQHRVVSAERRIGSQNAAPESERRFHGPNSDRLRFDVRLFVHDGAPLLFAARMYHGQTTNFRTPGGGFAPVAL